MILEYGRVEPSDLETLIELYTEFLNGGDDVAVHLRQSIEQPGFIGVKCVDAGRIVGVFTSRPGISFTYEKPELTKEILEFFPESFIATGDMLIVLPRYRGRGVGGSMTKLLASLMREAGVEYFLMEMWDKKSGDEPARGMVKYVGTIAKKWVIPDFYKELYLYGMTCPDCGSGHCTCGATVAIVALSKADNAGA